MSGLQGVKGLYEKRGWFYFQPPTPRPDPSLVAADIAGGMKAKHGPRPKPVALKTRDLVTALQRLSDLRTDLAIDRAVVGGTLKEVLPQYFAAKKEDALVTRRSRERILTAFMNDTGNPKASELSTQLIEKWRTDLMTRTSRAGQNKKLGKMGRTKGGSAGSAAGSTGGSAAGSTGGSAAGSTGGSAAGSKQDGKAGRKPSGGAGSKVAGGAGSGADGGTGSSGLNIQTGKPLSGTTIKTYTICLRAFVNWLLEQKILRTDPMAKLKRQTRVSTTRRHEFLTESERERLLAVEMPDHARLVLMLGFFAGLRDGEMLAMTPDWLWISPDQSRGSITVQETPIQFTDGKRGIWKPKTRQCRTIPMHPRLIAFIQSYGLRRPWMLAPEKELWPDESKMAKRFDAKKALYGVAKRAGIGSINFHILRHSFATHLAMKGVPLAEIAGLLGDSLRVTEDHYAGFCPNKVNPLEVL